MAGISRSRRLAAFVENVASDDLSARGLRQIVLSFSRIAANQKLDEIDHMVAQAASLERAGASFFAGLIAERGRDSDLSDILTATKEDQGEDIDRLLRKFDQRKLPERLRDVAAEGKFRELAEKARDRVFGKEAAAAEKAGAGAPGKAEPGKEPAGKGAAGKDTAPTPPSTELEYTRPDGTSVKITTSGETRETTTKPVEKEGPPAVYGEEVENGQFLFAIAIDRIECVETTDYTAAGILSFGIAGATGVDDEIGFVSDGTARFKGGVRTPFLVPSERIHTDVSDGDVLSDRPEAVKPSNENPLKLSRRETFLVNRFVFRGVSQLGQAPILTDMAPFHLGDFMRADIRFSLFEDDSAVKKAIKRILEILQEMVELAKPLLAATGVGGAVTATLEMFESKEIFRRLNATLQSLISSADTIGSHDFLINAPQIKVAFETGPVRPHPPNAIPPSYEYVTDRAEQIADLYGDGAHYRVILRYERHRMN